MQQPMAGADWWIQSDPSAVAAEHRDDVFLILRLGLAANALRAQMRFIRYSFECEDDAAKLRDLNIALVQAAAFTHEAIEILSVSKGRDPSKRGGKRARVQELAAAIAPQPAILTEVERLLDNTHDACPIIERVRNQLAFHWDRDELRFGLRELCDATSSIIWLEGTGWRTHEVTHRAAVDALRAAILRGKSIDAIVPMIDTVMTAMKAIIDYFDAAVRGYLTQHAPEFIGNVPPLNGDGTFRLDGGFEVKSPLKTE